MPSNPAVITDKQRNHCIRRFLSLTFFISIVLLTTLINQSASAQPSSGKIFTVTIDAGHGGKDTGAPGKKSFEKNIALGIALKLGHYIESLMEDVNVFYTRKTDVFITLDERAQIANRNNSDLFISIHVNAIKNKTAPYGTSTYVMGFSKSAENLDLVMQENKAILLEPDYKTKYAGFDPTSPESYIIFNNVQNNNLTQSLELAASVQDELRTRAQRKDIGVHQGNFLVFWKCAKPCILVETGFITNPREEEFLMTEDGQDIIASAIYMAFREYKESADEKVGVLAKNTVPAVETEKKTIETVKKTTEPEKKTADTVSNMQSGSDVEYRVQVIASVKKIPLNAKEFKGVQGLKEIQTGGYYKYLSKPVKTYQEALELRRQMGASFNGAFIVAFKNGERIPYNSVVDVRKN